MWMPRNAVAGLEFLTRFGYYEKVKKEFYHHALSVCSVFFRKIRSKYKKSYFQELKRLCLPLKNDREILDHLEPDEKAFACKVLDGRFYAAMFSIKDLRRFLFSLQIKRKYIRLQILGFSFSLGAASSRPALVEFAFLKNRWLYPSLRKTPVGGKSEKSGPG